MLFKITSYVQSIFVGTIACVCIALVMGSQSLSHASTVNISPQGSGVVQLIAGTYSEKGSQGIYGFSYNVEAAAFSEAKLMAKAENPSYIHIESDTLYVANELGQGRLTTYKLQSDGSLSESITVPTNGASPCYVTTSPDKQFVATANYMGGNVSIFNVDDDGVVKAGPQLLQHSGKGPNKSRQEAPHAHWVQWGLDQSSLYAVDLGIDEIKVYPFDNMSGRAGNGRTALKLSPGDGPRHMYFHPSKPLAYILNELSNTIVVAFKSASGELTPIQRIDTLPEDFIEHSQAGHIYITQDGKTLYTSNRGHDSIAVFSIASNGLLTLLETTSTEGDWPRHFLVLEDAGVMIVANQESQNIVALTINIDGTLSSLGIQMELPQSTYLGRLK